MIFLTLGTHQPFDRLVEAVDAWCGANPDATVVGQVPLEKGSYVPTNFKTHEHIHIEDYRRLFHSSQFVVAHAGMGTIITALCVSRPILVFPRRADLREQRNDHQLATAQRFCSKPGIRVACDREALFAAMDALHQPAPPVHPDETGRRRDQSSGTINQFADPGFVQALRSVIAPAGQGASH